MGILPIILKYSGGNDELQRKIQEEMLISILLLFMHLTLRTTCTLNHSLLCHIFEQNFNS